MTFRRLLSASLVWTATLAGAGETGQAPAVDRPDAAVIAVELNRIEPLPAGCRLSFVIENRTPHAFESMQWDLFFFDPGGLIAGRMGAEAAPLAAGKTKVRLFDLPDLACKDLGRILINDVLRCDGSGAGDAIDCLQLTVPSSRTRIEFYK